MVKGQLSTVKDLNTILSSAGPCLTVYMTLDGRLDHANWRDCVQGIQSDLVPDWHEIEAEIADEETLGKSIAVFRSADAYLISVVPYALADRAVLGPHFFIRPLLKHLLMDESFYVLALSQKNTRLLHCSRHAAEEVPFPLETKADFDVWMNQAKPDHTAVNNAVVGGRQSGSGPSALAPKGSDDNSKSEYLSHYFKQINHGVNVALFGRAEPLNSMRR